MSRCTSGRAIPQIAVHTDKPCGRELVNVNGALMCPRCDAWPTLLKKEKP